jgi:hypothetical protein
MSYLLLTDYYAKTDWFITPIDIIEESIKFIIKLELFIINIIILVKRLLKDKKQLKVLNE